MLLEETNILESIYLTQCSFDKDMSLSSGFIPKFA